MTADLEVEGGEDPPHAGGVFEAETGHVWVQATRCDTCVFHPDNRMHLAPGRLADLVRANVARESHLTCHDTLLYGSGGRGRPAVCRGYFDHPQGNARALALRLGRALRTIRYQQPHRKDAAVRLSQLIADTGITMTADRGEVTRASTGFTGRHWQVTYRLPDGRAFPTTFFLGNVDEEPTLAECLDHSLQIALRVENADGYEEWAQVLGGSDRSQWQPHHIYAQQVWHTRLLRAFLGEDQWEQWMAAAATPAGQEG